jgi:hypothetical protein
MPKAQKDGVYLSGYQGVYYYVFKGKMHATQFSDRVLANKAYATAVKNSDPKYAELFAGKNWRQIFSMLGLQL